MKYKYFLRGFGFGILFATIIIMLALTIEEKLPQNNSSNKEVLSEQKDSDNKNNNKETDNKADNDKEDNKETEEKSEEESNLVSENKESEENTDKDSSTTKKEEATEKETTSKVEESTSEEETTTKAEETTKKEETTSKAETSTSEAESETPQETTSAEMVVFTLSGGMSSNQVAQALKDLGVVDDAEAFNRFMERNGTAKKLRIGVYQIPKNASYEDITKILVKKN